MLFTIPVTLYINNSMKNKSILTSIIIAFTIAGHSQNLAVYDLKPYFSAVMVSNIDSSTLWYQAVLNLKIKNRMDAPEQGFKVVIFESSGICIELIEKKSSPGNKKILEKKPEETDMQGFFKIGFKVSNIDAFINHLSALKLSAGHIYTDPTSKKRNFLIKDPDGNPVQFFE